MAILFFSFVSTTSNEKSTPDINYDMTKQIFIGTGTHDEQQLPFLNEPKTHGFMSRPSGVVLLPKNHIYRKLYDSMDRKKATFTPTCILTKCDCLKCWSLLMSLLQFNILVANSSFLVGKDKIMIFHQLCYESNILYLRVLFPVFQCFFLPRKYLIHWQVSLLHFTYRISTLKGKCWRWKNIHKIY